MTANKETYTATYTNKGGTYDWCKLACTFTTRGGWNGALNRALALPTTNPKLKGYTLTGLALL